MSAVQTPALVEIADGSKMVAGRTADTVAALRVGLAAFGADGTLELFNPRFSVLMGLPPDLLSRGMAFTALLRAMRGMHEYSGPEGEQFLDAQAVADRAKPGSARRRRPNGQVLDIASDPLEHGGWSLTVSDITTLALAEDESRQRIMMLDALLESIPYGICVYGPDGRASRFNRAYNEVMAGAEVAVGDHLDDVIRRRQEAGEFGPPGPDLLYARPEDRDFRRPQIRPRRRRPNGTFIDVRSVPLPDGGHVSVVTDVTPLAQAEIALAAHAAEMEAMLNHTRHGVILWSAEQTLIASNRAAAEVLEIPPEMLARGLKAIDLMQYVMERGAFGSGEEAEAYFRMQLAHDRAQPLTAQRVTTSGKAVEIRSDPMPSGGYVVTYTDVTELRRVEQEMRAAIATADEANAAKARFLSTMSHELRTPLNSVIGFSDTLMRDRGTTEPAQVREYAEDINTAGKRLLMLINNMLDIARIEAGRFDLGTDRIQIQRMVHTCLRQHRAAAGIADVELFDEIPLDLPLVRGDERRLQQVLNNLLSNAIKFTEAGGTVSVTAELDVEGDLLIAVTDTGIGIPNEQIPLVFEPFTQIDSGLARRFEGTGLGLYFSRALVRAHGGMLSLRSVVGQGTTAEIRLPARRLDDNG